MSTLTDFLLARITEDERTADLHERLLAPQLGRLPQEMLDSLVPPARLRADCEAKRRIVEHEQHRPEKDFRAIIPPADTPVLRLMALPYDDHPDYRDEWRP